MKYSVTLIFVVVVVAVTDCVPSSMKQYNNFNKFLEFIKLICQENIIDDEVFGKILKDPIFYEKYVPEESDKSIRQMQMLICPKEREILKNVPIIYIDKNPDVEINTDGHKSVNQEAAQKNSKAVQFTDAAINQTTLPSKSFSLDNIRVFNSTTQNQTHLQVAKDSVHTPYKYAPFCSNGSAIMQWLCSIIGYLSDMVSKNVGYFLRWLRSIII